MSHEPVGGDGARGDQVEGSAVAPFAEATMEALENADPTDPGVQPRPAVGVQFVAIPEFADLATDISEGISSAIAGRAEVGAVLDRGQEEAEDVASSYR